MSEATDKLNAPPFWRRYLAYATVALMPLSVNTERIFGPGKAPFYISPLDFLLPVLALLMLVDLFTVKPWARFKCPPLPVIIWAVLALASCFWSEGFPAGETMKDWARGAFNPLFFGAAAVWVFQNLGDDPAEFRRLALVLGASFSVCTLMALKQYAGPAGIPFDPDKPEQDLGGVTNMRLGGWYDYRGVFGAQAALLVPVAVAFALLDKDAAVRWASGCVAALALCVTLSGGGFVGASAGIIAVAGAYCVSRNWLTGITVVAALLALAIVVLPRLPRKNHEILARSLALFAEDPDEQNKVKPTARLRRYQAALNLLAAPSNPRDERSAPNWVKGVGIGRYQKHINRYFRPEYPQPGRRTDDEAAYDMESHERFTFGLLESVAVELGAPGLVVTLLLFAWWICGAQSAFARLAERPGEPDTAALLALAAFGSGCGALVLSIFAHPVIRGVGGSFAFFFAVALCAKRWADALQKS